MNPSFARFGVSGLTALIALLAGLVRAAAAEPATPRCAWVYPAQRLRTTMRHGPGSWRASALPSS
ncbi:MAG TPA: acyl-CoA carboxylase epsilon subunit [Pseudonocardiaceae bacterium]|nr:acyl-CoA carboxylase epsilon subunit [Pseudonocardiaceae bacterium]